MSGALPEGFAVDAAPAAALPEGFAVDPGHPVAGPTNPSSFWPSLTDIGRNIGTGLVNAMNGVAKGLPNPASEPGAAALGIKPPPSTQQMRENAFNSLGATEYQPATWWGRRGQDVASALPAVVAGGPEAAAGILLAAPAAGAASELFPNHPLLPALLGGMTGQKAGTTLANTGARAAGVLAGNGLNQTYQAFQRLNLPTDLAGDVSGNPAMRFWQSFAAKMPGGEDPINEARNKLLGTWNDRLETTAQSLGGATTPQEAGVSLKGAANQWTQSFVQHQNQLWGNVDALIPPTSRVDIGATVNALKAVPAQYGQAKNVAGVMQPSFTGKLLDAVQQDMDKSGTVSWQTIKQLRSDIGERLSGAQVLDGNEVSSLKRIYGALSDDMRGGAAAAGGRIAAQAVANGTPVAQAAQLATGPVQAFQQASAFTKAGHTLLDDHIRPIINATTPEQATSALMEGAGKGGTRLQAWNAFVSPSAVGDVASSQIRAAAGASSPTAFASSVLGAGAKKPALSPQAANVLFGHAQQNVADLATTGRAIAQTEKAANHSNTAITEGRGLGRIYSAIEMAKAGHEMAGIPGSVAGFGTGLMAPTIMGKAASAIALNPTLARLFATTPVATFTAPRAIPPLLPALLSNDNRLPFGWGVVGNDPTRPSQ